MSEEPRPLLTLKLSACISLSRRVELQTMDAHLETGCPSTSCLISRSSTCGGRKGRHCRARAACIRLRRPTAARLHADRRRAHKGDRFGGASDHSSFTRPSEEPEQASPRANDEVHGQGPDRHFRRQRQRQERLCAYRQKNVPQPLQGRVAGQCIREGAENPSRSHRLLPDRRRRYRDRYLDRRHSNAHGARQHRRLRLDKRAPLRRQAESHHLSAARNLAPSRAQRALHGDG